MKPWRPEIQDKAGRGALCSRIQQLTRDLLRYRPQGPAPDPHEVKRIMARLDKERAEFRNLYNTSK